MLYNVLRGDAMATTLRAVRLPQDLAARLEERCRATGKTRTQVIVEALEAELDRAASLRGEWREVRREALQAQEHLRRLLAHLQEG